MKTLLVLSHPNLENSDAQQFLISSLPKDNSVTLHHLEANYPNFIIDLQQEIEQIQKHDQIIFQFPFYWYSAPAMLKQWQDQVLTALQAQPDLLANKKFGLVISIGVGEQEYQAGGKEQFSLSELTKPYQAIARYFKMSYLVPLTIFQFSYLTEAQKMTLLIDYQQYFEGVYQADLKSRGTWVREQLEVVNQQTDEEHRQNKISHLIHLIEEQAEIIADLKEGIEGI